MPTTRRSTTRRSTTYRPVARRSDGSNVDTTRTRHKRTRRTRRKRPRESPRPQAPAAKAHAPTNHRGRRKSVLLRRYSASLPRRRLAVVHERDAHHRGDEGAWAIPVNDDDFDDFENDFGYHAGRLAS